uniref:Uncharacterized protein n=1 Tax=Trichobilharzia regenti TaxID=157069 RepID=A0AA85ISK9_TRIRE|nr:unnamed protein product [Trichobilharzia regenti]
MDVFDYCLDNGLIALSKICQCGGVMHIQKYTEAIDGFVYRCIECRRRKSVREGNFLSRSKLPLKKILMICNFWVLKRAVTATAYETENSGVSNAMVQLPQRCFLLENEHPDSSSRRSRQHSPY